MAYHSKTKKPQPKHEVISHDKLGSVIHNHGSKNPITDVKCVNQVHLQFIEIKNLEEQEQPKSHSKSPLGPKNIEIKQLRHLQMNICLDVFDRISINTKRSLT
jgi:hypothetical protein